MIQALILALAFAPWQDTGNLDSLMKTGMALAEQERYSDAAEVFAKCVKAYPTSFEAGYNLALAEFALKNFAAAEAALSAVKATGSEELAARNCLQGKVFLATGRRSAGLENMARAFHASPEDENCALDLGLAYIRAQEYQPAIGVLEESAARHKDSELLLLELALADALGGKHDEALRTSQSLIGRNGDQSMPRLIAAFSYYMSGRYEECVREASQALAVAGANPYLYYLRASAAWKMNSDNYATIVEDLEIAFGKLPGCSVCLMELSKVHEKLGDVTGATADLLKVTDIDAGLAQAWYRLSSLYRKQGKLEASAAALQRYHTIKTDELDREQDIFRRQTVEMLGH